MDTTLAQILDHLHAALVENQALKEALHQKEYELEQIKKDIADGKLKVESAASSKV